MTLQGFFVSGCGAACLGACGWGGNLLTIWAEPLKESVLLLTIKPNRCLATWSVVLLLLGLACPVAAAESLARLSFWMPSERKDAFVRVYEKHIVPVVEDHGLAVSQRSGRATADSVFTRLFAMGSPAEAAQKLEALRQDSMWEAALEQAGVILGIGAIRAEVAMYETPVGPGKRVEAGLGKKIEAGSGNKVEAGPGFRQGIWQAFGIQDGLPSEVVLEMLQDSRGDIWFSTLGGGVCRYDGHSFTTFTTADGLAGDWVWPMLEDRVGNLWFGTSNYRFAADGKGKGISRYDGKTFTTFTMADGLAGDQVMAIEEDRQGHLWFGTWDNGVSRYDGQTFTTFTMADGLVDNRVQVIKEDRQGDLWFGTRWCISRYDGQNFTSFTIADGLVHRQVWSIEEDRQGRLWFGTRLGGVSRFDGQSFTTIISTEASGESYGTTMFDALQDREGNMWFSAFPFGLNRYDGQHFTAFTTADGLSNNQVMDILEDREGTLWIATFGGGVSRYDGGRFTEFTTEQGVATSLVFTVMEDRKGNIWAGTLDGLNRFDGREWTTFKTGDGLTNNVVLTIIEDRKGILWIGTDRGVTRYDGREFTPFPLSQEPYQPRVEAILEDSAGNMWFGATYGGDVYRYDGTAIQTFTTDDGLVDNTVATIKEDRAGNVWFGTSMGASRYDGERFETFSEKDGLANNLVRFIFEDRQGHLWFATVEGGVSRYDGRTFETYDIVKGLANNHVLSIAEDREGHLWFATFGGGVSRYDGQVFQTLSRQDGLINDAVQEVIADRQGQLWFATEGGLTRHRPSQNPPGVAITQVLADRAYTADRAIRLSSSQDFVLFSFRGWSFTTRRQKLLYLYRLQGYEDEWHQTRQTQAQYDNLPTGDYVFQVKVTDLDLNYSETAELSVVVHPPYGQIALVSGLGVTLVGLVLATGYSLRKRRELRRAEQALMQELEEELQTAHDLQMSLMPTESPQVSGFDIAGRCETVNHVGGDFYQYFPQDGKLSICMADVTGHAMEAAVPVMMFSGVLHSQMEEGHAIEGLFARLNNTMNATLDSRTFVCFTMGELDLATRAMRLANGGCPYPYHYRSSAGEIAELEVDAYPLGVRAGATYTLVEISLEMGDYIIFCSDGIIEAGNAEEDIFGFEQTAETIRAGCTAGLSAEALIDRLMGAVQDFAGDTPPGDDMTCVVLRVEG